MNPNRIPRPQFKGCPFGCLDWTTCPHTGHARAPAREDAGIPPETYHRAKKELKMDPKNVLQRKYAKARAQARRDALKRLREEV